MRYLAIDLGDARTGLALGDDSTGLVTPLAVLEVPARRRQGQDLLDALADIAHHHLSPGDEVVVGLPLRMDGTPGPRAEQARSLALRLQERLGRRVHLQDERLSSAQADWSLARTGLTHGQKKARRDALAAAVILRDFLARRHPPPSGPGAPS